MINIQNICDAISNTTSALLLNALKTDEDIKNFVSELTPYISEEELDCLCTLTDKNNIYLEILNYVSVILKERLNNNSDFEQVHHEIINILQGYSFASNHLSESLEVKLFFEKLFLLQAPSTDLQNILKRLKSENASFVSNPCEPHPERRDYC